MKKSRGRNIWLWILILTLGILPIGCGSQEKAGETPGTAPTELQKLLDDAGYEIRLEKEPERVISLTPSHTEIIYALGAGEKLVAVSEFCNYPAAIEGLPHLGTGPNLNAEMLTAYKPDLVVMGDMDQKAELAERIRALGIPVAFFKVATIEETYDLIEKLGRILNKEQEAAKSVAELRNGLEALRTAAEQKTDRERIGVYMENSPLAYGLWTCGQGTFQQEIIDLIGARNIFEEREYWQQVSEEQIISLNPGVIISVGMNYGQEKEAVEEIKGRRGWDGIKAVREERVYALNGDLLSRPTPRLLEGAKALYEMVYEEEK